MKMSSAPRTEWWVRIAPVLVRAVSWPVAAALAVSVLAQLTFRLLAEKARRRTLIDVLDHAPGGSVVFQEAGPGGPTMWVWVGDGLRPPPGEVRVFVEQRGHQLPGGE
jgi:hypothetical protein